MAAESHAAPTAGEYIVHHLTHWGNAEAKGLVDDMLHATPLGLRLTKECLNHAIDAQGLEAAIAMEDRNQILASSDGDFAEGVQAFLEKRRPVYTKREG